MQVRRLTLACSLALAAALLLACAGQPDEVPGATDGNGEEWIEPDLIENAPMD